MGSWDCYCVLCSGPLGIYSIAGANVGSALKKRRKRVVDVHPDSENESEGEMNDNWSQASDFSFSETGGFSDDDEMDGMNSFKKKNDSDPDEMTIEDVQWVDRCRCLGFNPDARGVSKAFISGRGRYDDYGGFHIMKPGHDPNDTGEDVLGCCYTRENGLDPACPFHEACFEILTRCLGYKHVKDVDKDVLYGVLASHMVEYSGALDLDYGLVEEPGQFWGCMLGEEYSVCDPGPKSEIKEKLQSMLPASLFASSSITSTPPSLAHKVRYDPLGVLPYDILHDIFKHLSTKDAMSLMTASWHVLSLTQDIAFWKHMLHLRIAPWLWELNSLLATSTFPDTFDFKGLFLWLDEATKRWSVVTGPLKGIANRRRIWTVCQQIAPLYHERVSPDEQPEPEEDEARSILDSAVSLHMPAVLCPQPKDPRTISAQFIRSWSEIAHHSCGFDTYWSDRDHGALVGIGVTFGHRQRIFGSTAGIPGLPLHIEAGDWIREIEVYVGRVRMLEEGQDRSSYETALDVRPAKDAYIEGMKVILSSGKSKTVRSSNVNVRPFIVLEGMHFIGLTGQVAANGVISRLGLLQAFCPGEEPTTPPSYSPAQQMLWSSSSAYESRGNSMRNSIWAHPKYRVYTFPTLVHASRNVHTDMVPHESLLWADSPAHSQSTTQISCFQVVGGIARSGTGTWETIDIVGIREGNPPFAWPARAQYVGTGGPVPIQAQPEWYTVQNPSELDLHTKFEPFDEAHTLHFDIDGPGGEKVTEVHVSAGFRAIKLVTNRGRECCWGEGHGFGYEINWFVKRAEEGEVLLGLSCCFGNLGGWSSSAKMSSHWKLSYLGVITMRIEDEWK